MTSSGRQKNTNGEDTPSVCHTDLQCTSPAIYPESSWEDCLLEQQDHLEREMEEAKKMISAIQALLLNRSLPEDEQQNLFTLQEDGACPEEQLVIIKSRLDQSMSENQSLKNELLNYKQENRNLQGIEDALQQRLATQESSVLQLKQELLRANMDRHELQSQNVDLQRKMEERSQFIADYKKDLTKKEWLIQQLQGKLDESQRKLSEANYHKTDLQKELDHRKALPQQYMNEEDDQVELSVSRYSIYSGHSCIHFCILFLFTRCVLQNGSRPLCSIFQQVLACALLLKHFKVEFSFNWDSNPSMPHSQSTPVMGSSNSSTKVLYFTDRSLTPFMVTLPKRLGEVTLRDFRAAIGREGSHRYHFKALDPEFGTVKVEVFHDEDIIPGWEGKIVAWVEEDHGSI
ncbi:dixin-like [Xenopus laevis]|uniref:Dixin-like n=1 Tax=Xenopus laevis TaxID=8355 RepID=A0A8J1LWY4_XENLA|nr:dixin-like [Xenopus laevis]